MANKNSKGTATSATSINGGSTSSINSTITVPSYSSYAFPNSSGSISSGSGYSTGQMYYNTTTSYNTDFEFDSKVIDIEKLSKFDEPKRKLVFDLIIAFVNCSDFNAKKLMLNTLNSYGIIGEKKTLERKIKIANITNEKS